MKLSTIAKTVQCPFCQTGYTFKTLDNKKNWQARGASEPLHAECKAAAREQAKKSCSDCGGDCASNSLTVEHERSR